MHSTSSPRQLRYFILTIICLVLAGFQSEPMESPGSQMQFRSYAIDVNQSKVNYSDVFDEVTFLPLEETDESLLGNLGQVSQSGDKFALSVYDDSSVYIFTSKGKFLSKFNQMGQAEGMYEKIRDIWLDDDVVTVFDNAKGMLHKYDLQGKPLSSSKSPEGIHHLFPVENGYVADMNFAGNEHKVLWLNEQMELQKKLIPLKDRINFPMGRNTNSFRYAGGELIFNTMYMDTVYAINSDGAGAFFHIDFGDDSFWQDGNMEKNTMQAAMAIPQGKGVWNYNAYIGKDHVFITYRPSLAEFAAVLNRTTGAYKLIKNMTKGGALYELNPISWQEDRMLFTMPSHNVADLVSGLEESQWSFEGDGSLEKVEASENPVLLWVKFKEMAN